jgi:cyclic pyranopterin monophosphate synthase
MEDFSHFNKNGRARMVDVSEKSDTARTAVAAGRVLVNAETFKLIKSGGVKKGDVLAVAQVGGIMGAKHTSDIIPMCHPIMISGIDLDISLCEEKHSVEIIATTKCTGATGVEMEALTAVSVAALTVYDMCKAVQRDIEISDIRLLKKTGGKSGVFERK